MASGRPTDKLVRGLNDVMDNYGFFLFYFRGLLVYGAVAVQFSKQKHAFIQKKALIMGTHV